MRTSDGEATGPTSGLWPSRFIQHLPVRYLAAGCGAFLFDLALLALFKNVLGWPLWLATGAAFLLSFAFTYTVQRFVAFQSTAPHGGALIKYTVLVAANTLATIGIVALIDLTPGGWIAGKVVSTAASTVWNYFAYRYWVFAGPRSDQKE